MSIEILQAKAFHCRRLGSPSAVVECIADGADELRGIVWVDQGTDCALRQRINAPITISADNRQTGGRGFKKRDAKSLACARHDKNVSETKVVKQLADGRHAQQTCIACATPVAWASSSRRCRSSPSPTTRYADIRNTLQNPRQSADHPVMPLVALRCREPRHCEKHSTSTKLVMLSEIVTLRPSSELRFKGIRQNPHALRRYIRPF